MKRLFYTDSDGFLRCSLVRDDDVDPKIGIPVDPPPIERIICENAIEVRNELVRLGILSYKDISNNNSVVSTTLQNILRRKIVEAYKLEELNQNGK